MPEIISTTTEPMPEQVATKEQDQLSAIPIDEHPKADPKELVGRAKNALVASGLEIDPTTPPYKNFGPGERFFIQRCHDAKGCDVVAKIAAPEKWPVKGVVKESHILSMLDAARKQAEINGMVPAVHFPEKAMDIQAEGLHGLATKFVEDDKEAKRKLPVSERMRILTTLVKDLHKLDVPPEVFRQKEPYWEQEIPVRTGEMHLDGIKWQLDKLQDSDFLTSKEKQQILSLFVRNAKLIDTFPLKFSHGDIHAENFAYVPAHEDQKERLTLMDLEALKVDNEFADWAILATRARIGQEVGQYKEELMDLDAQLKRLWMDESSAPLEAEIESGIIGRHERGKDAEIVYRLMRLEHCLDRIEDTIESNGPRAGVSLKIYSKIVREQLEKLKAVSP